MYFACTRFLCVSPNTRHIIFYILKRDYCICSLLFISSQMNILKLDFKWCASTLYTSTVVYMRNHGFAMEIRIYLFWRMPHLCVPYHISIVNNLHRCILCEFNSIYIFLTYIPTCATMDFKNVQCIVEPLFMWTYEKENNLKRIKRRKWTKLL